MNAAKQPRRISELRRSVEFTVVLQIALLVFTSLILDGGDCAMLCLMVILGYWLMVWGISRGGGVRSRLLTLFSFAPVFCSGGLLWSALRWRLDISIETYGFYLTPSRSFAFWVFT
jgi:hypothetical protein